MLWREAPSSSGRVTGGGKANGLPKGPVLIAFCRIIGAMSLVGMVSCASDRGPKLAEAPTTPASRLAAATLVRSADLPDDFKLAPALSFTPPAEEDPAVCDGFQELSGRFGEAVSSWGIDYRFTTRAEDVIVSQASFVWRDPIAVERRTAAVEVALACFPARVEVNLRKNVAGRPLEVVSVSAAPKVIIEDGGVMAIGVRVTSTLKEAGLIYSSFYDFLYLAHDRITVLLTFVRQVDEPDGDLERSVVWALSQRLRDLQ